MRHRLFTIWVISLALLIMMATWLTACNGNGGPTATPTPITTTPSPSPGATPTPGTTPPTSSPSQPTTGRPLNVTLDYIGIKSNQTEYSTGTADIYLLTVITDGYEKATQQFLPAEASWQFDAYQTIELKQDVFHTDAAGESLKVCILAYKRNDPQWQSAILIPALAEIERGLAWGDYRSAEEIITTVDKHMVQSDTSFTGGGDSLIGYFEDVWGSNESLGIGQYQEVGTDDLRLWFSIWSTEAPKSPPLPTLLPDVEIEEINMLATASTGQTRTDIVRIHNNEPHPLTVTLKGSSLLAGEFHNHDVALAADGYAWVETNVNNPVAGVDTITYAVYLRDSQLDSDSKDLRVITDKKQITLVEWRNSDGTSRIDKNILDGTPITLYVEAPGYTGVTFTASIRIVEPDGSYKYEKTLRIPIITGYGLGRWTAEWQAVVEGDPTYVFGIQEIYSNELTVVRKYETPPDINLESVNMVAFVNAGEMRTDTVTIRNNEDKLMVVRLRGSSSDTGEFYNRAVSLPAESTTSLSVPATLQTAGVKTITYQLYFQGAAFDTWSGTLEVF